MKTKDITISALFTVFIIICSFIKVPLPYVPFTLQVFAITFTALTLTRIQAVMAIGTYFLLGFIGIPVFAGGQVGPQVVFSPTFGFLIGFMPMAFVINTLFNRLKKGKKWLAFVAGELLLYTIALPILYLNLKYHKGVTLPMDKLFISYFLMFVPTDSLSMLLAYFINHKLPMHSYAKK